MVQYVADAVEIFHTLPLNSCLLLAHRHFDCFHVKSPAAPFLLGNKSETSITNLKLVDPKVSKHLSE